MSEEHHLNGLDSRIDTRGYFERILTERDKRDAERDRRLDERFESQEKAVDAALAAAEKAVNAALLAAKEAVNKAEEAQLRVNVTQNEFRGTLKDQAADLMPRAETELLVRELAKQIGELKGTRREGVGVTVGYFFGGLAALATVIGLLVLFAGQ